MPAWVNIVLTLLANPLVDSLLTAIIDAIIKAIGGMPAPAQLEAWGHLFSGIFTLPAPRQTLLLPMFIARGIEVSVPSA